MAEVAREVLREGRQTAVCIGLGLAGMIAVVGVGLAGLIVVFGLPLLERVGGWSRRAASFAGSFRAGDDRCQGLCSRFHLPDLDIGTGPERPFRNLRSRIAKQRERGLVLFPPRRRRRPA